MEPSEAEKARIWDDVRREFPDDEMMQEIHYIRALHHLRTGKMTPEERIRFFEEAIEAPSRRAA